MNRSPAEPGQRTAPASTKPFPAMSFRVDITPQPDPLQSLGSISMNRFFDQRIRFTNRSSTLHSDLTSSVVNDFNKDCQEKSAQKNKNFFATARRTSRWKVRSDDSSLLRSTSVGAFKGSSIHPRAAFFGMREASAWAHASSSANCLEKSCSVTPRGLLKKHASQGSEPRSPAR